jgi:hypothetical protein
MPVVRLLELFLKTESFLGRWLPVFLWAAVIFTLSSIEQVTVSQFFIWDFIAKKVAHVSEYAFLYLLLFRATGRNYLLSFIVTIIYAISDEVHQSLVPGRTAAIYDLGFDLSGANIAGYVLWKLSQIRKAKPKK